jgi:AraC-type DNA-binding domain-containing proteins
MQNFAGLGNYNANMPGTITARYRQVMAPGVFNHPNVQTTGNQAIPHPIQRRLTMNQPQPPILKEVRSHGTKSFPCAIYRTQFTGKCTLVKHHWHNEAEILYFSGGEFRLEINMEPYLIDSECLYFINPGELHSILAETSDRHWEDAIVFSPGILGFDSYDEAQIHLVRPLQNGALRFPRCILPGHPAFAPIQNTFQEIMHTFWEKFPETISAEDGIVTDDLASQLYVKSSLLRILAILSGFRLFTPTQKNPDRRVETIKTALTYIRENYSEKIYIADLARQVNLNEQYFCRFFKKAIGRSPMEYVNEYRIRQARRLLEETDLPVMEVCLECGCNNLGNFLREFRKYTGTTPLQYRKKI